MGIDIYGKESELNICEECGCETECIVYLGMILCSCCLNETLAQCEDVSPEELLKQKRIDKIIKNFVDRCGNE